MADNARPDDLRPAPPDGAPRVSVIVICYNNIPYIDTAIRSVIAQTERDIEIIVVDDGSTDGSRATIEALASQDARITVLTQPNSGRPAVPRNTGLRVARGAFVCFLDGDDAYEPAKIERELDFFGRHPEVDVTFHDMRLIDATGTPTGTSYLAAASYLAEAGSRLVCVGKDEYIGTPDFYKFMSTRITGMHTSTVMVRKTALDAAGAHFAEDAEIGMADDIDMWFRIAKGRTVGFIDEVLSSYRQHPVSLSARKRALLQQGLVAHLRNLSRASDVLSPGEAAAYRARLARQYQFLGYDFALAGEGSSARRCYRRSFALSPNARAIVLWLKSFVPRALVGRRR
jgi:glycosyltransferase involved in cell wall biosynthesis